MEHEQNLPSRGEPKEHVEVERVFESVDDAIKAAESAADIRLRTTVVRFAIAAFFLAMLFLLLHSLKMIVLPTAAVIGISGLLGGEGFGLGSLLYYIAKDLFRRGK